MTTSSGKKKKKRGRRGDKTRKKCRTTLWFLFLFRLERNQNLVSFIVVATKPGNKTNRRAAAATTNGAQTNAGLRREDKKLIRRNPLSVFITL